MQSGVVVPLYGKDLLIWSGKVDAEWQKNYINTNCNPKSTTSKGFTCSARIIENGWKMDY